MQLLRQLQVIITYILVVGGVVQLITRHCPQRVSPDEVCSVIGVSDIDDFDSTVKSGGLSHCECTSN